MLNPAQKEAVEYLDGPLLVLAGPGTGKTQLLSAKVEYILNNTDTNPENILCLTFTDAGAMNMRTRLGSMVGVKTAAKVAIHTYHAFGADLLAKYKNYAESPSRRLDSPLDQVAQYKIITKIQDTLDPSDILKSANPSDLIETIAQVKSSRLTATDLTEIANYNIKASAVLSSEITPVLKQLKPRMKFADATSQVYSPLMEILARHTSKDPITKQIEPVANLLLRDLDVIIREESGKEKPFVSPLTKWKNANFEKDDHDNYRLKDLVANKKLASLAHIMSEYDTALQKDGLFDFADMIEEAISALKNDRGFRLSLQEHYQFVLLDEFQDTNPSQFELIKLITDYERPVVMAVGDDDQAIFAFQGANASNLLDFQNHYDAKLVILTENYRSVQEILNLSRHVANNIEDSFAKNRNIEKRLTAHLESTYNIKREEFPDSSAEYSWVANEIASLIKQGIKQQDIAIIAPKHKYIAPLLPYLKTHKNLYVAYEKRENVLEDPQVQKLTTLARYLNLVANNLPASHLLPEILSYSFWNLKPLSVLTAFEHARETKTSILEQPELETPATFLAETALKSLDAPLEEILSTLVSAQLGGISTTSQPTTATPQPTNEDRLAEYSLYENLSILREHLKNYFPNQPLKLKDFIAFLDDYEAAGEAILNTSPYQESADAIQILTAHKAKGLEYRYVFLIATDDLSWGNAKGNNNLLVLPKNLQHIRHTGSTDDERRRLFFVAITRAKTDLIMTNSKQDFAGKKPPRLEYLEEYEDTDDNIVSPFLPEKTVTRHTNLEDAEKQLAIKTGWITHYANSPDLKPLLLKRLENYRLTATDLTTFIDLVYAGPLEFYKRKVLRAPSEPTTDKLIYGNLIHSTFEAVTKDHLTDDEAIDFMKKSLKNQPLTPHELEQLEKSSTLALETSLKSFGDVLRAENSKAELDLSREHLLLDADDTQIPITGKIDHVTFNPENKTAEVYDFKTGPYHKEQWTSHQTLLKYALQLGFYKLLLNSSPTYKDYEVTRAHILFVTPDPADGQVYDKIYNFDPDFEKEEIALISAVYRQIKTLNFLDDPALAFEPDNSKTLKDIKEFINYLISH